MRALLLSLLLLLSFTKGQFGIFKDKKADDKLDQTLQEASIDANGNIDSQLAEMARSLQSVAPINAKDASHIAVLLEAAKTDPETQLLLAQMPQDTLKNLKSSATPIEIVKGLQQGLDELKAIDILFSNPERAVIEMYNEGLFDKKRLLHYKKNPSALEEDTRKGIYFTFISLAAAGDYL
jgi:hypothetical protein